MRAYSQDLRDKVIKKYVEGVMRITEISKIFGICRDTVHDWVKRYKKNGDYTSKQGVNCGRVARFNDKDKILEYLKSDPNANGITLRDAVAPDVPMSTFYDTLAQLGITYKKKSQNISKEVRYQGHTLSKKSSL